MLPSLSHLFSERILHSTAFVCLVFLVFTLIGHSLNQAVHHPPKGVDMRTNRTIILTVSMFACFVFALQSYAADDDKAQAIAMVEKTVALVKNQGKAKTIDAINANMGDFVNGSLYVFAYDFSGTIVAHPKNSRLLGKKLYNVPDLDGKMFRQDIVNIAKTTGSGWVDYKYKNPSTGKIEDKTTYVMGVDGLAICCGVYK